MESQPKFGFDGTQAAQEIPVRTGHPYNLRSMTSSSLLRLTGHVLRAIAIVLTFIAAIVMGAANQSVKIGGVTVAKFESHYSSAYVYFVVANVLVLVYSVASLVVSLRDGGRTSKLELLFAIIDSVAAAFLFTSNGAASAVSVAANAGIQRFGWRKICGGVGTFCSEVKAAIALSMFASVAYLLLVLLLIVGFYQRLP